MQKPETTQAAVQRRLWGTDPRAWADLAEAHNRPLFEAVLDAAGVTAGTRVLDVGCGSGLALQLARERGASSSGLDITPGLLGIARERLPDADLREVRAIACSAGGARAIEEAGRDAVDATLREALAPFERADGVVNLDNTFRWVAAR